MAYFFVFIAGLGGCILVTAFLGLIRVGLDNRYAQLIKQINIDLRMNQIWMICSCVFLIVSVIFFIIAIKDKKKQIQGSTALLIFSLVATLGSSCFFANCKDGINQKKEMSAYIKENYTETSFNEVTKDMTEENYEKFIKSLNE
ncbi:MAG: hypothetical protein IJA10_15780 [Lachnospiraceae bacterium]|nr:hypothetical protein [Lachnospiraceae bacterium]